MGGTMSLSPLVPRIQMCERCRGIAIWGLWLKTRCFFWACLQPGCLDQDRLPNAEAVPLGHLGQILTLSDAARAALPCPAPAC